MHKRYLILLALSLSLLSFSQQDSMRIIKFKIYSEPNEPLPGATLYYQNSDSIVSIYTDVSGYAQLNFDNSNTNINLYFVGPHIMFDATAKADSILINLYEKRIYYYYNGKMIRRKKLKVKGY